MPPERSMSISGHNLQMHCFNISKSRYSIFRSSSRRLKKLYYNHTKSIRNKQYTNDTSLSNYRWEIKKKHQKHPLKYLKWSIVRRVPACSNITKKCLLCFHETLQVVNYPHPEELLNKRSELVSKWCHTNKYLLSNYKANG